MAAMNVTKLGPFKTYTHKTKASNAMSQARQDVDRAVFNYGRAIGVPPVTSEAAPWLRDCNGSAYRHIDKHARALAEIGNQFSAASWALDMALAHVRHATSAEEQAGAMATARALFAELDTALENVRAHGVAFHRFGRVCQHV